MHKVKYPVAALIQFVARGNKKRAYKRGGVPNEKG